MDTLIGQTLSHYRIVGKIGAGGMGEVYRALDTRLGRDVAIKALPAAFSSNPDRLLRFEREAKVLASLNHPNLAAIHGMEEIEGRRYLALEYVEGETLAARLARGPLPLQETIEISIQIAMGMEAAHERGIIHRDLKPGNVMITPGDQVKVVDFGLAKGAVSEPEEVSPDSPTVTDSPALAYSPTIRTPATLPGVILGTAAYLSPEQARGKVVDRRTDIWAFGCVVYECLTGRPAFEGETFSDVIARILRTEPDWKRLPGGVPPAMRALLRRCLEKDPLKRLRDMGDARLALEEIREGRGAGEIAPAPRFLSSRVIALGVALALLSGAAGVVLWNRVHRSATGFVGVRRASIEIPHEIQAAGGGTTPDGRYLIVDGRPRPREGEQPARPRLYLRRMDGSQFEAIEGSEGFSGRRASPDGGWLYFTRPISDGAPDQQLVKTLLQGSVAPVAVANWGEEWDLSSWIPLGSGDVLVGISHPRGFGGTAYVRVSANGAASPKPIRFDVSGFNGTFQFEEVLPRDRGVLLNTASYAGGRWQWGVAVLDLKSGKTKILLRDCGNASYVRTGHLVYARGPTLLGVPFDLSSLAIRGEPVALVEGLRSTFSGLDPGSFTLSTDGTLVYRPGGIIGAHRHLIVVDGQGRVNNWTPDSAAYIGPPRGSPDGRRVACAISNNARGLSEIWMSERGRPLQRVAAVQGMDCGTPVWSPDGNQIAFSTIGSTAGEGIYVQSLGGGAPRRVCRFPDSTAAIRPTSWSPDGKYLLATATGEGGSDVVGVATSPSDSLWRPVPLITGPGIQTFAQYSPDGRYVAYRSDESGRGGIYVAPIRPDLSLGAPVFAGRGSGADWSKSGRELFILTARFDQNPRNRVVSVSIQREPVLSASAPVPRWDVDSLRAGLGGDILRGDLLINIQRGEDEDERDVTSLACVFNFFEELKQKIREAKSR